MSKKKSVDLNYIIRYLYKKDKDKVKLRKTLKSILPKSKVPSKKVR